MSLLDAAQSTTGFDILELILISSFLVASLGVLERRRTPRWRLALRVLAAVCVIPAIVLSTRIASQQLRLQLACCGTVAVLVGYCFTIFMIPELVKMLPERMCGHDQCKSGAAKEKLVPESLGLVVGINFLVCVIVTTSLFASNSTAWSYLGLDSAGDSSTASKRADLDAAMLSTCFMLLLGVSLS